MHSCLVCHIMAKKGSSRNSRNVLWSSVICKFFLCWSMFEGEDHEHDFL